MSLSRSFALLLAASIASTAVAVPAAASTLQERGNVALSNDCANEVLVEGDYAFVARNHDGADIIDISNPDNPVVVARIQPEADSSRFNITSLSIDNGRLFLGSVVPNGTSNPTGVYIYDISTPSSPVAIGDITWGQGGGYHFGANVYDVEVETRAGQQILYAASRTTSLVEIFDVTNPAAPVWLSNSLGGLCDWSLYPNVPAGCFEIPSGYASKMLVDGGLLYTAFADGGIAIHDVSDPSAPVQLSTLTWPNAYAVGLDLMDTGYLVTVDITSAGATRVIDVLVPEAPALVGAFDGDYRSGARDVTVSGDFAFVSHYQDGLYALNLEDPSNPTVVGHWDTDASTPDYSRAEAMDVAITDDGDLVHTRTDDGVTVLAFGDDVDITRAQYSQRRDRLTIRATTTADPGDVVLTLEGHGELSYNSRKGYYQLTVNGLSSAPASVTVSSNANGSDTIPVDVRR